MTRKARIRKAVRDTVSDLVTNFLYYDRKEDESLSVEDLEQALADGAVTRDEIVAWFRDGLTPEAA